jgi:hypothetical protein
MVRHRGGLFQRAAVFEIRRDAGRPKLRLLIGVLLPRADE